MKTIDRVTYFLNHVRRLAGRTDYALVNSKNHFPTGCGIASSAAGFAALALAASRAYGLDLSPTDLSCLARLGSGSAARSVFGGFVELRQGDTHASACAEQLAPESHWTDLRDLVIVVSREEKSVLFG